MARWDRIDTAMTILVIIWGNAFVGLRRISDDLDPFQIMWYRFVPFLAVFGLWLVVARRRELAAITGPDWLRFTALGFLGVIGYHVPVNLALRPETGVTAATGAVLVATTPLWTLVWAALVGAERITPQKLLGSAAAFAGVLLVVLLGRGEAELSVAAHASLILVAAILWSGYSIIGKPLVARYGGMVVTGVSFSLGTLMLGIYGWDQGVAPLARLSTIEWVWLVYISVFATVIGYAIWNYALAQRTASEVTSFIYFIPVVATIAGWLILGETITLWFVLGSAMVILGVRQINLARAATP